MKRRIALLMVIGVMQGTLQIKASEDDGESNRSGSSRGALSAQAIIDEWSNNITVLTNQNHALNEYNKDLSAQLMAHKLCHQYAKRLLWQQKDEIRQLEAQLKEKDQLIEHQSHTIQELRKKAKRKPYFP